MSNAWFRMYHEFASDAKVQMMSEQYQRRLVMLFCLRCNSDVTLQDSEVAFQLRIGEVEWGETKREFIARGFLDADNNLLNWNKRQYRSDSSAERVRKHRESKRNDDVTTCNVTVTPPDTEQIQNRTDISSEDKSSSDSPLPKISFNFTERQWEGIGPSDLKTWGEAYPAVGIERELKEMAAWLHANPKNKKSNYTRFINNWLSREQDKAPRVAGHSVSTAPPDPNRIIPQSEYEFAKKMVRSGQNPTQFQRTIDRYETQTRRQ